MINIAPMAIECPIAGCDLGENSFKYKTPVMESALQMMKIHRQSHQQVQGAAFVPVSNRNMRERQKKPSAGMEMSEATWRDFLNQWACYKWPGHCE